MEIDYNNEVYSLLEEAKNWAEKNNYQKALEIYKFILILYSDNKEIAEYTNACIGDIYLTMRELEMATKYIDRALVYNKENPEYHYLRGFTFLKKCEWPEAIREFQTAIKKKPHDSDYLRGLGWAIYSKGNHKRGLELLHKAVEIDPYNVYALTDLAVAYITRDIHESRVYAERAIESDPDNSLASEVLTAIKNIQSKISSMSTAKEIRKAIPVNSIYRFKVSLKSTPYIWRIVEIQGNQMLSTLHKIIYQAFDRSDQQLYSFFMNDKAYDKNSEYSSIDIQQKGKSTRRTRIESLSLKPGKRFLYLFDYVDEYWHEIELLEIRDRIPNKVKYPRINKRSGKSPCKE
ncbi:MAG: tetratricopeptide repeat protein [Chloroflexi bacterium]|nr:tetratricopeptide repeat protein [Chloroflexota bacterium]